MYLICPQKSNKPVQEKLTIKVMKHINILPLLSLVVLTCASPDKRSIFDAGGQKPITSFLSKKLNTVSILFGNQQALETAKMGRMHQGGEVFTLVTWNQQNKEFWYPALINGRIKSIEVVKLSLANNRINQEYSLVKGPAPANTAHIRFKERERIDFILSQRASVYP